MSGAPKETSPFLRALGDLLSGARHANELAEVLVTEAVQRTLARVATDYPLDYTLLLDAYQADVVAECCSVAAGGGDAGAKTCAATTKAGKQCVRRAVMGDVCMQHLDFWQEQQATQRRQQAYATSVRRDTPKDPYEHELKELTKRRKVAVALPADA